MSSNDLHHYWESRLTDAFNLEGVGYLGLRKQYNSWLYRVRRHALPSRETSCLFLRRESDDRNHGLSKA